MHVVPLGWALTGSLGNPMGLLCCVHQWVQRVDHPKSPGGGQLSGTDSGRQETRSWALKKAHRHIGRLSCITHSFLPRMLTEHPLGLEHR